MNNCGVTMSHLIGFAPSVLLSQSTSLYEREARKRGISDGFRRGELCSSDFVGRGLAPAEYLRCDGVTFCMGQSLHHHSVVLLPLHKGGFYFGISAKTKKPFFSERLKICTTLTPAAWQVWDFI